MVIKLSTYTLKRGNKLPGSFNYFLYIVIYVNLNWNLGYNQWVLDTSTSLRSLGVCKITWIKRAQHTQDIK